MGLSAETYRRLAEEGCPDDLVAEMRAIDAEEAGLAGIAKIELVERREFVGDGLGLEARKAACRDRYQQWVASRDS